MPAHRFVPEVHELARVQPTWDIAELTDEIGVYAASPEFVRARCGPVANTLLDAVPASWFDACAAAGMLPNIDVRVHRLNRGEYAAVPGWHCDGALRESYFGQPDVERVPIRDTILCCVSTHPEGVANPEYAIEAVDVDIPTPEEVAETGQDFVFWREIHKALPAAMETSRMLDGQMLQMSCHTLHRVLPAHNRGARLLFRMSMWHNDYLGDGGRVALTQQRYRIIDTETVWVTGENSGW